MDMNTYPGRKIRHYVWFRRFRRLLWWALCFVFFLVYQSETRANKKYFPIYINWSEYVKIYIINSDIKLTVSVKFRPESFQCFCNKMVAIYNLIKTLHSQTPAMFREDSVAFDKRLLYSADMPTFFGSKQLSCHVVDFGNQLMSLTDRHFAEHTTMYVREWKYLISRWSFVEIFPWLIVTISWHLLRQRFDIQLKNDKLKPSEYLASILCTLKYHRFPFVVLGVHSTLADSPEINLPLRV